MKKIVALIGVAVIVLSVAAAALIPAADPGGFGGGDVVYVLRLSGTIQESGSSFPLGSGISPAFVRKRLGAAEEAGSVKAVVVRLDSGGGTVAASQGDRLPLPQLPQADSGLDGRRRRFGRLLYRLADRQDRCPARAP